MRLDVWVSVSTLAVTLLALFSALGALFRNMIRREVRAVREDTQQLRKNGGRSVADHVQQAKDISQATLDAVEKIDRRLSDHLIDAAAQRGAMEARMTLIERIKSGIQS